MDDAYLVLDGVPVTPANLKKYVRDGSIFYTCKIKDKGWFDLFRFIVLFNGCLYLFMGNNHDKYFGSDKRKIIILGLDNSGKTSIY